MSPSTPDELEALAAELRAAEREDERSGMKDVARAYVEAPLRAARHADTLARWPEVTE